MDPRTHRRDERGDTLLEVLFALAIIALTLSAFLSGFVESVATSGQNRSQVTLDTVLKSFAEATKYDVQYMPLVGLSAPLFRDCASIGLPGGAAPVYTVLSTPSPTTGGPGTAVTLFGVGYSANSPLTVTLTDPNGNSFPSNPGVTSDANGDFTLTFVPAQIPNSYSIMVTDSLGFSATSPASYSITMNGTVTPTSPLAGYHVAMKSVEWWNGSANSFDPPNSPYATCANGTAEKSGIQRITLQAMAQDGTSGYLAFVVVNPETTTPAFTSPQSASFTAGEPGQFTVTASGYPLPSLTNGSIANGNATCTANLAPGLSYADNANGTGTVTYTNAPAGTYTLCITATNSQRTVGCPPGTLQSQIASCAIPQTLTITVVPAKLLFTTQPGGGASGAAWPSQPQVTVEDAGGTPITMGPDATTQVTLAIATPSGSGATLTCTNNTVTAINGVASFVGCTIVGPTGSGYSLAASAAGMTGATSTTFSVGVGAPAKLVFTTQPGGAADGSPFGTQPTVAIEDSAGNVVSSGAGSSSSVSLAIGAQPGTGAVLGCPSTTTVTALAGVASFVGCQITGKAGAYTLTATVTGLPMTTSISLTITFGSPAMLVFTAQPGGGANGSAWDTQPAVSVEDAQGNVVASSSAAISLAIAGSASGGATIDCTSNPLSASSGVASYTGCTIVGTAGMYQLTASASGLTSTTSTPFRITFGAPSKLVFSASPNAGVENVVFRMQPMVTVEDSGGNVVTNASNPVTLAITAGTGSPKGNAALTCAQTSGTPAQTSATPVNGVAGFASCMINDSAPSVYSITATSGTLSVVSTTFTIMPASVVSITSADGNGQPGSPGSGDTIVVTFSGPLDPTTLCSVLTAGGKASNGSVTIMEAAAGDDMLTFSDGSCLRGVNLFSGGSLDLGARGYVTGSPPVTTTFGSGGGGQASSISIDATGTVVTLTLGKASGPVGTVSTNPGVTYAVPGASLQGLDGVTATGSATDSARTFF
jgi:type II secretory pathway pseudopilin PulG